MGRGLMEFFWRLVYLVFGIASVNCVIATWLLPLPFWGVALMTLPLLLWMLWTWERTKQY